MIQDIFPHKFNNQFKGGALPTYESEVMLFCNYNVMVLEKDGQITFPKYRELLNIIDAESLTYFFALDDKEYYGISVDDIKLMMVKNSLHSFLEREQAHLVMAEKNYFRSHGPKEMALVAVTGMHLNGWYNRNKFCGACGFELEKDTRERMVKCLKCGNMIYPRINPAVIVGVTRGDEILLTKYRGRTYKNYALVAGFTEIGESFEDCVRREVKEETGLDVKNIKYYKSQPWGFADDILAGYFCQVDGDGEISMDVEELSMAQWVKRDEIDMNEEDLSLTNEMIMAFRDGKQ